MLRSPEVTQTSVIQAIHSESTTRRDALLYGYFVNEICSLQTFDSPLSFHNADVGRCIASELLNVTDATETAVTTDVPSFTVEVTHPEPSTTTRPTGPTQVVTVTVAVTTSTAAARSR